jgi:diguanylate cyclase (GGDEF)-like protein
MQIRTLFLVCMLAVAATAAGLGVWMLTGMMMEYQLAGRVERAVEFDTMLFVAADKIALERPVLGDALLAEAPADAALHERLLALRGEADTALDRVDERIGDVTYPGAAAQLALVRQTRASLAIWRANVDAALTIPRSQRDPNIFTRYIVGLNTLLDSTTTALDIGDLDAALHDGITVELMALARYVWNVRATMGVRTVPLMSAIDSGGTLNHDALEGQARYDGALTADWMPVAALARRLSDVPGLAATIAAGQEAFDEFDRLCHEVIAASRDNAAYPVSALELGRHVVRAAPIVLKIRDDAIVAAHARVAASRQQAGYHVVMAGIILAFTMVAVFGVLILLQRRIVMPVVGLTAAIDRIARHEFNVTIPARTRTDEIGRMATALEALRQGAMAGEANKAQIVRMARQDALTGLPNRFALQQSLEQAVALAGRGHMSAALCLDLDRFKAVNDTFGHPAGDVLLKTVADRLLDCVRDVDTVSRLGGDEFVVLLIGIEAPEDATVVAQRIVSTLNEPFIIDGQSVGVGASVGIAITPQDATSWAALLKCADTALYSAKSDDRGSWRFFSPEMNEHLQERMLLERELRDAVQTEAFELVYQPHYNLRTQLLCGFEALLRWHHPQRGPISPATFIPIAEETGLIVPIGAWVLRHACAEAMQWPEDVRLSVNLSGVQFKEPAMVKTVQGLLAETGLPADRLELEITETMLLTNSAKNRAVLQELHAMGIQIAMDDFGTGYSSLSYLRSFPFDKIKIDQSFIREMSLQPEAREIVNAIVAMANSLGMTTTAEGVETVEQLDELRRMGCTDVQGYLFSKPLRAADARLLMLRGHETASEGFGYVASPTVSAA